MAEVEDQINQRGKTANAETGMMGFYKNLLTKNSAVGGGARQQETVLNA